MRNEGWESLLAEYLETAKRKDFAWGRHDCALFAGTWVLLCTGRDYVSRWRGEYASERKAKALLAGMGHASVADLASAHLPERPVTLARRGDLLLHPIADALGICHGLQTRFATKNGLLPVGTLACRRAWAVE